MCSSETERRLPAEHQKTLLRVASLSIEHGLKHREPLSVNPGDYPEELRAPRATFVTLEIAGALRGCIGSLHAVRPLVADVAHNAYAAAFHEPRFPPLTAQEFERVDIHISLLNPPEQMRVASEEELLRQVRPFIDGLILEEKGRRGTLLPSAWDVLPDPADFVRQIKLKAGLPADYWSSALKVWRYTADYIPS